MGSVIAFPNALGQSLIGSRLRIPHSSPHALEFVATIEAVHGKWIKVRGMRSGREWDIAKPLVRVGHYELV